MCWCNVPGNFAMKSNLPYVLPPTTRPSHHWLSVGKRNWGSVMSHNILHLKWLLISFNTCNNLMLLLPQFIDALVPCIVRLNIHWPRVTRWTSWRCSAKQRTSVNKGNVLVKFWGIGSPLYSWNVNANWSYFWYNKTFIPDISCGTARLPNEYLNPLTCCVRYIEHLRTNEPVRKESKNGKRTKNKRTSEKTKEKQRTKDKKFRH